MSLLRQRISLNFFTFIFSFLIILIFTACEEEVIIENDTTSFITTWDTRNTGYTLENKILISTNNSTNTYTIDWGDDNIETVTGDVTHTYAAPGIYTISISGDFPRIYFDTDFGVNDGPKLLTVQQWGNISWKTMNNAFANCQNMQITALDTPDLSLVTDMSYMFYDARIFNSNINSWDTSKVTNMSHMFYNANAFNQPLNNWNMSLVEDTGKMFYINNKFNQDLSSWDVSRDRNMSGMFAFATDFNQEIAGWNTQFVEDMSSMFLNATSFNTYISSWDTSLVRDMTSMFEGALDFFNHDLSSWNVISVTSYTNFDAFSGGGNTLPIF